LTPKEAENQETAAAGDLPADNPADRFCLRWPLILARLAYLYSRLYSFRHFGYPGAEELDGPAIFTCWHCEEVTLLPHCGFTRGHIMISRSRDGDILASVVQKWGYLVSRGSSSRGAVAALRSMRRAIDRGDNLILAVDGPRGPRQVAKPGAFYLAAKTGRPIYPVGVAVSSAHVFKKSWSHSRLPWPFSRVTAVFGQPIRPTSADLAKPAAEQSGILANGLHEATQAAEKHLKNWYTIC
jgi:lysophospholipid acyltransferase (LPLAT)-like uncharacterized protein